jgi:hypothetical protein
MANYQLPNDVIRTFHGAITALNAAGVSVPVPAGSTYTATADDGTTSVNVVVAAPDFTINATGPNRVGISVTFAESGGPPETSFVWLLDTVDDVTPAAVGVNTTVQTTDVPQPAPAQTPPAGP